MQIKGKKYWLDHRLKVKFLKQLNYSVLRLMAIAVAVLLVDVGVQAIQVTNVARIYTLDAQSNSRINTVYMTTYFIGGAVGTSIGLFCWHLGGWNLVTWQMLVFTLLAFFIIVKPKITTARINNK